MASHSRADAAIDMLSFSSFNDEKASTIVLLHGGFTCRLEFALVVPHLSDFHIIVPDLPMHSASRHLQPGTVENAASLVANLIRSRAHGGKAHVVGVSMGGYVGQCLALHESHIVLSLFVTGSAPLAGRRLFMARWPKLTYSIMIFMLHVIPTWLYRYRSARAGLTLSDELVAAMRGNVTWGLIRDMFPWVLQFKLDHVRRLRVRVLSIAGAKGDDVPTIIRTAEALKNRKTAPDELWPQDGSGGTVLRNATHGWDVQFPELFARGVSAWVRGQDLPREFERV